MGPYALAFSTGTMTPPWLVKIAQRYKVLAGVLGKLQRAVARTRDPRRRQKLEQEIALVADRRTRLRRTFHDGCSVVVGQELVRTRAGALLLEALTLETYGTRRALAKAISTVPDDPALYERAVVNVSVFQQRTELFPIVSLSPRGTSLTHWNCPHDPPGKIRRSAGAYDAAPCDTCQIWVNTHYNAAQGLIKRFTSHYQRGRYPHLDGRVHVPP